MCIRDSVDSEGISQLLRQQGYQETDQPEKADLLIVNTCGFIEPARAESLAALKKLARRKRRRQLLIAAGCLPQREDVALKSLIPRLDGVIGTRHWAEIATFVAELRARKEAGQRVDCFSWQPAQLEASSLVARVPRLATMGTSAYLKIADGCDALCAFCTIPVIKGPQQSKLPEAIIAEARELAAQGVKEIILIAQDTTAYGRDLGRQDALPDLIKGLLAAVPDLAWLRLMYTYPQHITPRLIRVMAEHVPVCHYLDIPLQHSHPDVLRRMRRSPDMDGVRRLIQALREAMPDVALRTTFIVGYPGETEAEFVDLLRFMREIAFDKVGIFPYSREQGTLAASLPNQIPDEVKEERYQQAMSAQQVISLTQNRKQVGRTLQVLVEGTGDNLSVGRSYRDAPEIDGMVFVSGQLPLGQIVPVRITQAMEYDLAGEPNMTGPL